MHACADVLCAMSNVQSRARAKRTSAALLSRRFEIFAFSLRESRRHPNRRLLSRGKAAEALLPALRGLYPGLVRLLRRLHLRDAIVARLASAALEAQVAEYLILELTLRTVCCGRWVGHDDDD